MDSRFMNPQKPHLQNPQWNPQKPRPQNPQWDHDSQRLQQPGGVFGSYFDPEIRDAVIDDARKDPAYNNPNIFSGRAVQPLTEEPDYVGRTFLRQWGEGIKSVGRPLPMERPCPYVGCSEVFGGSANSATLAELTRHLVVCNFKGENFDCDCGSYKSVDKGPGKLIWWRQGLWRHVRLDCVNIAPFHLETSRIIVSGDSARVPTVIKKTRMYDHYNPVRKSRCPVTTYLYGPSGVIDQKKQDAHIEIMVEAERNFLNLKDIIEQEKTPDDVYSVRYATKKPCLDYTQCYFCSKWFATPAAMKQHWKVSCTCEGSSAESHHNYVMGDHFVSRIRLCQNYLSNNPGKTVGWATLVELDGVPINVGRWLSNQREAYCRGSAAFKYQHLLAIRTLNVTWAFERPRCLDIPRRHAEHAQVRMMVDMICDYFRSTQFQVTKQLPTAEQYFVQGEAPFVWLKRQRTNYKKSLQVPSDSKFPYIFPAQTTTILEESNFHWLLTHDAKIPCYEEALESIGEVFVATSSVPAFVQSPEDASSENVIRSLTSVDPPANNPLRSFWIKTRRDRGPIPASIEADPVIATILEGDLRKKLHGMQGTIQRRPYDPRRHAYLPKHYLVSFRTINTVCRAEGCYVQKQFVLTHWSKVNKRTRNIAISNGNEHAGVGLSPHTSQQTTRPSIIRKAKYNAENDRAIFEGLHKFCGDGHCFDKILECYHSELPDNATARSIENRFKYLKRKNVIPQDLQRVLETTPKRRIRPVTYTKENDEAIFDGIRKFGDTERCFAKILKASKWLLPNDATPRSVENRYMYLKSKKRIPEDLSNGSHASRNDGILGNNAGGLPQIGDGAGHDTSSRPTSDQAGRRAMAASSATSATNDPDEPPEQRKGKRSASPDETHAEAKHPKLNYTVAELIALAVDASATPATTTTNSTHVQPGGNPGKCVGEVDERDDTCDRTGRFTTVTTAAASAASAASAESAAATTATTATTASRRLPQQRDPKHCVYRCPPTLTQDDDGARPTKAPLTLSLPGLQRVMRVRRCSYRCPPTLTQDVLPMTVPGLTNASNPLSLFGLQTVRSQSIDRSCCSTRRRRKFF